MFDNERKASSTFSLLPRSLEVFSSFGESGLFPIFFDTPRSRKATTMPPAGGPSARARDGPPMSQPPGEENKVRRGACAAAGSEQIFGRHRAFFLASCFPWQRGFCFFSLPRARALSLPLPPSFYFFPHAE